jgi:hypothetical protein
MKKEVLEKPFGLQKWIRTKGSPNDPESFELASWNGIAWQINTKTRDGRILVLSIPDYMVSETLPPETNPEQLYKPLKVA